MRYGTCEIFEGELIECDTCCESIVVTDDTFAPDIDHHDCIDNPELSGRRGYFYWCCFMGCLPEGDAIGPFNTEKEAVEDALDNDYIESAQI